MSIKGNVQTTKTNDWGYTSYKVSSTWYGADSKGPPRASEGELVEFEAFDKPGQGGKVYPTIKLATFRKVAAQTTVESPGATGNSNAKSSGNVSSQSSGTRDTYWSDKAAEDAKKDPRIAYQSSYDRAISFVDLAIRNGAFEALGKAKQTAKLEILQAFVDEQAERIMRQVYVAKVPESGNKGTTTEQVATDLPAQPELEFDWS